MSVRSEYFTEIALAAGNEVAKKTFEIIHKMRENSSHNTIIGDKIESR